MSRGLKSMVFDTMDAVGLVVAVVLISAPIIGMRVKRRVQERRGLIIRKHQNVIDFAPYLIEKRKQQRPQKVS